MSKFLDVLILKDTLELSQDTHQLKQKINSKKSASFKIEWLTNNEFKFIANFSLGTFVINQSGPMEGIKGYAKISELNNGNTRIDMRTKVRVELYLVTAISFVLVLLFFASEEKYPYWILLLLPVMILWLWFTYRVQEKRLFKKLKQFISNN